MATMGHTEKEQIREDIELLQMTLQGTEDEDSSDEEGETGLIMDVDCVKDEEGSSHVFSLGQQSITGRTETPITVFSEDDTESQTSQGRSVVSATTSQYDSEYVTPSISEDSLVQDPETCLALNRAYQELIRDYKEKIVVMQAGNRARQVEINDDMNSITRSAQNQKPEKKISLTSCQIPYFKDSGGHCPPENMDVMMKRASEEPVLPKRQQRNYNKHDKQKFIDAVKADNLRRWLRPLMNRLELQHEKLQVIPDSDAEQKAVVKEIIAETKREIERIQSLPHKEMVGTLDEADTIDWMKMSTTVFESRSASHLQQAWRTSLHPSISRAKWKDKEDEKLVEIVESRNAVDWEAIAKELDTGRTAIQCIQRYQQKLNKNHTSSNWTEAENEELLDLVENAVKVDGNVAHWNQIALLLEGRTDKQCQMQFQKIDPTTTHGRWNEEEDRILLSAIRKNGPKNWIQIAKTVPGRNSMQCRERWFNALSMNLRMGAWTYEEDRTLFLSDLKGQWAKLAMCLPGRTDNQVMMRWRKMKKWLEFAEKEGALSKRTGLNAEVEIGEGKDRRKVKVPAAPVKREGYSSLVQMAQNMVEQQTENADELKLIREDRANNIFVPRPPEAVIKFKILQRLLDRRLKVYHTLTDMFKVAERRRLDNTGTEIDCVTLKKYIEKRRNILSPELVEKLESLVISGKSLSIREVKSLSKMISKKMRGKKILMTAHQKTEEDIIKNINRQAPPVMKKGRPKKIWFDVGVKKDPDEEENTRKKVSGLLMRAFSLDPAEMQRRAMSNSPGSVDMELTALLRNSLPETSSASAAPPVVEIDQEMETTDDSQTAQSTGTQGTQEERSLSLGTSQTSSVSGSPDEVDNSKSSKGPSGPCSQEGQGSPAQVEKGSKEIGVHLMEMVESGDSAQASEPGAIGVDLTAVATNSSAKDSDIGSNRDRGSNSTPRIDSDSTNSPQISAATNGISESGCETGPNCESDVGKPSRRSSRKRSRSTSAVSDEIRSDVSPSPRKRLRSRSGASDEITPNVYPAWKKRSRTKSGSTSNECSQNLGISSSGSSEMETNANRQTLESDGLDPPYSDVISEEPNLCRAPLLDKSLEKKSPELLKLIRSPPSVQPKLCVKAEPPFKKKAVIYNIPPLPPTRTTLFAFRSLLLERRKLLANTQKFMKEVDRPEAEAIALDTVVDQNAAKEQNCIGSQSCMEVGPSGGTPKNVSKKGKGRSRPSGKVGPSGDAISKSNSQIFTNNSYAGLKMANGNSMPSPSVSEPPVSESESENNLESHESSTGYVNQEDLNLNNQLQTEITSEFSKDRRNRTSEVDSLGCQVVGISSDAGDLIRLDTGGEVDSQSCSNRGTTMMDPNQDPGRIITAGFSSLRNDKVQTLDMLEGCFPGMAVFPVGSYEVARPEPAVQPGCSKDVTDGEVKDNCVQDMEQPSNILKKVVNDLHKTHDYQMLRSRFLSLFVWPALLSATEVPTKNVPLKPDLGLITPVTQKPHKKTVVLSQNGEVRYKKKKYPCTVGKKQRRFNFYSKEKKEEVLAGYIKHGEKLIENKKKIKQLRLDIENDEIVTNEGGSEYARSKEMSGDAVLNDGVEDTEGRGEEEGSGDAVSNDTGAILEENKSGDAVLNGGVEDTEGKGEEEGSGDAVSNDTGVILEESKSGDAVLNGGVEDTEGKGEEEGSGDAVPNDTGAILEERKSGDALLNGGVEDTEGRDDEENNGDAVLNDTGDKSKKNSGDAVLNGGVEDTEGRDDEENNGDAVLNDTGAISKNNKNDVVVNDGVKDTERRDDVENNGDAVLNDTGAKSKKNSGDAVLTDGLKDTEGKDDKENNGDAVLNDEVDDTEDLN